MKRSKILAILLALALSLTVFCGALGCDCTSKQTFTVRFVGGEGAVLVSGKTVQTVEDARDIQPPVFEKQGYVFNGWSVILRDIKEDTTVEALWYSGYKVVLGRRYRDKQRGNREVTIVYSTSNTVAVYYDSTFGETLFPKANSADEDYVLAYWELVLDDGRTVELKNGMVFNDELFCQLGMTESEAFNMRGKTLTVNPILKFVGSYAPSN